MWRVVVGECRACCRWNCTVRLTRPPKSSAARSRPPRRLAAGLQRRHTRRAVASEDGRARLTEFVLLCTLALRAGKVIKWDAEGHEGRQRPAGAAVHQGARIIQRGWELPV